jgi:catechol 2,3-dioxygenase-like lactoylglutathione lyase family enzyme
VFWPVFRNGCNASGTRLRTVAHAPLTSRARGAFGVRRGEASGASIRELAGFDCGAIPWHRWRVLHSLDRVVLVVPELDVATRQYARLLGRTPSWRGEQPVAGTENSLFRLRNAVLEIVAPTARGPVGSANPANPEQSEASSALHSWSAGSLAERLKADGEGLLALVFGSDDVEAFRTELLARGLQPSRVEKSIDRDVESGAFREWRQVSLSAEATRGVWLRAVENLSPDEVVPLAAALAEEHASVLELDHAVVQTRDSDATRSLYGDGLGLRLALERDFPKWGSRLQFFRVGGVTIEVAASYGEDNTSESVAADAPLGRDRLWGLCWRVPDAVAAQTRMQAAGFDVSQLRDGRKPGTRVFSVRAGTCGVPTLVLEPPA